MFQTAGDLRITREYFQHENGHRKWEYSAWPARKKPQQNKTRPDEFQTKNRKKRTSKSDYSYPSEDIWQLGRVQTKTNMANKSRVASAWLYSATRTEIIIVSELLLRSCIFFHDKKGLLLDAVSMFHSFTVRAFDLLAVRIYGMADCNSKIPTT